MKIGAEKEQKKLLPLNEADGPVFKIHNDPRHTRIGRFLFHTGLDELPQLVNVLKGEMAVVGPRPLPVGEEIKIAEKYQSVRRLVKPGLVSPWIVNGYHKMKFEDWMKSDVDYVAKKSVCGDAGLLAKSIFFVVRLIWKEIFYKRVNSKRMAELVSR